MIRALRAGCPAVDIAKNQCQLPGDEAGQITPCTLIRECDGLTGALHYQYALPAGTATNANILTWTGDHWEKSNDVGTPNSVPVIAPPSWNPSASVTAAPSGAPVQTVVSTPTVAAPRPTTPSATPNQSATPSPAAVTPTGGAQLPAGGAQLVPEALAKIGYQSWMLPAALAAGVLLFVGGRR